MSGLDERGSDLRKELDATLQARKELGEEYDAALVESFLEKVDRRIDDAVERRVRRQLAEQRTQRARDARGPRTSDSFGERFGFGIVSLVLAVPLSAIGGHVADLPGLIVTWAGIVGVNVAHAARTTPGLFAGRRQRTGRDDAWQED
ncbi:MULTISPECIES: hypothetical protein [Streptomyces]|uniref:Integral membrane protein n=1 Tax=Streptomyces thermoviolaceus subsp. thermoviolaceus TaxID=66860 RepID=A0ABX0YWQ9_STRTL|nr:MULTISPECIES: hypothetical protein [Streptomyces]NJP16349.1 hypothetical protein [Streptomyces thermoviolaceus subsp. thermoviolaceus]RSS07294.1 hypothetical protein EF917_05430 [Streptomyces sp. WAC00469]WTD48927.1 hypothetical protein OG899_16245 [Streptomyces thermoviolaceus]